MDMNRPKVVTVTDDADVDRAIATLVLAFSADPVARWMYNQPDHYLREHFMHEHVRRLQAEAADLLQLQNLGI
jgi:hypothetical protein